MASNMSKDSTLLGDAEKGKKDSDSTTPADGRSLFSGRGRSNTETTLVSSVADDSRSVSTVYNPNAPVNSPVNGSIAGDGVDPDTLLDRVKTLTPMSDSGGKLSSVSSPEGGEQGSKPDLEAKMEAIVRGGVQEGNLWAGEAVEMATLGLKRLIQLAKDEHDRDGSKSVEEYYSEHLGKLIKDAEIKFDAMNLQ